MKTVLNVENRPVVRIVSESDFVVVVEAVEEEYTLLGNLLPPRQYRLSKKHHKGSLMLEDGTIIL